MFLADSHISSHVWWLGGCLGLGPGFLVEILPLNGCVTSGMSLLRWAPGVYNCTWGAAFSWNGAESKYFRFPRPHVVSVKYSTLLLFVC